MSLRNYLLTLLSFAILGALSSCSKKPAEEVTDAIDDALTFLSAGSPKCQEAIDVLEKLGRQTTNARYMSTLASAYACRGGFSELALFDEVDTLSSEFDEFLGSLAQLSDADETAADSARFNDLQTAIDLLLYAGGKVVPSAADQKVRFGNRQGSNLNLQAMYMILIQLGRFARWYGNTDDLGVKGGGPSGSTCFMDYTYAPAGVIAASHAANACSTSNAGHPDVDYGTVTASLAQRRLCKGAMLVNNMLDILENTTLSDNDALGDIATIYEDIQPFIVTASALDPEMPAFIDNVSQAACEADAAADDHVLQLYYAALLEYALP